MNLFSRFKEGLRKTREGFAAKLDQLLGRRFDPATFEELEELLLSSDVGPSATKLLLDAIQEALGRKELRDPDEAKRALKERIVAILRLETRDRRPETKDQQRQSPVYQERPKVYLFLGVNGSGKTTTIAKLAKRYLEGGQKVLLAAADTFRAAAIDQLLLLGKKIGAEVIAHKAGADPAAVVFDALKAAQARGIDHLFIDTAGRLHTKRNLMEELKKIHRIIAREIPGAPHESLLVLDATFGGNAVVQAREFHEAVGLTGLIITKLDGTAKGGSVIRIAYELKLPVKFVGIGEGLGDLEPFDPEAFAFALLEPL